RVQLVGRGNQHALVAVRERGDEKRDQRQEEEDERQLNTRGGGSDAAHPGTNYTYTFPRRNGPLLLAEDVTVAAGNQRRYVREDSRQPHPARVRKVARLPLGVELLFVRAQTLKVVEGSAVFVQEGAEPVPERHDPPVPFDHRRRKA